MTQITRMVNYDFASRLESNIREQQCEDYILVDRDKNIFIMADGHKGHWERDVRHAYEIAAHCSLDFLKAHLGEGRDMKLLFEETVKEAHEKIKEERSQLWDRIRAEGGARPTFGITTLEIGVIKDDVLHYGRVGDGILKLITRDGSLETPFDERHALDLLESSNEDGAKYNLYHQSTSHIGQYRNPPPLEYKEMPLEDVKYILMATDGLQYLNNERIKDIILNSGSLQDATGLLVREGRTNPDDRIVQIVQEEEPGTPKEAVSKDDISVVVIKRAYSEPEVRVVEMQTAFTLEAIARNARRESSELEPKYADYTMRYRADSRISRPLSFGRFLSREHKKIEAICSHLENASHRYKRKCIEWCMKQFSYIGSWIRKAEEKGASHKADVLKYERLVKDLYSNLTRGRNNVTR